MNKDEPNPHAPPAETSPPQPGEFTLEILRQQGPVKFSGSVTVETVNAYLRAHEHVGCLSMLMTATIVMFIFFVVMVIVGKAAFLVAIGVMGLLGMMLATSTLPYRRSLFMNSNPRWDEPVHGEIAYDGVRITQDDGESFFRWDWFDRAVVGKQVLVLIPALYPHQPILVAASMLTNLADADRIPELANALTASVHGTTETRRHDNRAILRSGNRGRSRDVPTGGIPFQAQVTTEDLQVLPEQILLRQRPTRAYLLIGGLLIFPSLLLIGVAQVSGLRMILVAFVGIAVISLLVRILMRRPRSKDAGGQTVFYLTAFADETGITSDFAVTVTSVAWQSMRKAYVGNDKIALSRSNVRQVIIARADMFEDAQKWQDFRALVNRKLS